MKLTTFNEIYETRTFGKLQQHMKDRVAVLLVAKANGIVFDGYNLLEALEEIFAEETPAALVAALQNMVDQDELSREDYQQAQEALDKFKKAKL